MLHSYCYLNTFDARFIHILFSRCLYRFWRMKIQCLLLYFHIMIYNEHFWFKCITAVMYFTGWIKAPKPPKSKKQLIATDSFNPQFPPSPHHLYTIRVHVCIIICMYPVIVRQKGASFKCVCH